LHDNRTIKITGDHRATVEAALRKTDAEKLVKNCGG
jgi:hypothetical protein